MYPTHHANGQTLDEALAAIGQRFTPSASQPPSPKGGDGTAARSADPSANGVNGATARSADPSANGVNGATARSADPSANGVNGRDHRGRFTKGNKGGPGNPFARRVARLRTLLLEIVGEDDLRCVLLKLVERAKAGDVPATRLLLSYLIGRPSDAVDPDRLDLEEWQLYQQSPTVEEFLEGPTHQLDPAFTSAMAPLFMEKKKKELITALLEDNHNLPKTAAAMNGQPPPSSEAIMDDASLGSTEFAEPPSPTHETQASCNLPEPSRAPEQRTARSGAKCQSRAPQSDTGKSSREEPLHEPAIESLTDSRPQKSNEIRPAGSRVPDGLARECLAVLPNGS